MKKFESIINISKDANINKYYNVSKGIKPFLIKELKRKHKNENILAGIECENLIAVLRGVQITMI